MVLLSDQARLDGWREVTHADHHRRYGQPRFPADTRPMPGGLSGLGKGARHVDVVLDHRRRGIAIAAAKLIDRVRGSRGASRAEDLPATSSGRPKRIDNPRGGLGNQTSVPTGLLAAL
jgi:hypothetical protein